VTKSSSLFLHEVSTTDSDSEAAPVTGVGFNRAEM
jgi:hypothetical protein